MASIFALIVLLFILGFLLGSIPWGLIISKLFFHKDIRKEGSGNIGTTNAMRSMGPLAGATVFLLDFGKGLLSGFSATVFASFLEERLTRDADVFSGMQSLPFASVIDGQNITAICMALAFLACVWGHIFSPWLSFKGGKGIACAVGCLFFFFGPMGAVLELVIFAATVLLTRYVSAGSLAAATACPFIACYHYWGCWFCLLCACLAAATVIWAHRQNIARLAAGCERKIGNKGESA